MAYSERYKRFLAAKQAAGDYTALSKQKPGFWVYFTDSGEIVGLSTEYFEREGWLSYQFTNEQVKPLIHGNWLEYEVYIDPVVDNLYSIQKRPEQKLHIDAEQNDLQLIKQGTGGDVHIKVNKKSLKIMLSAEQTKIYSKIDPRDAKARGKRVLVFYITANNDPHTYVDEFRVELKDLVQGAVTVNKGIGQCSIFTNKLFDNYTRTQG